MIKSLGKQIVPGSSALFIYVIEATGDKVTERMRQYEPEVLRTSLSHDAEEKLRQCARSRLTPDRVAAHAQPARACSPSTEPVASRASTSSAWNTG